MEDITFSKKQFNESFRSGFLNNADSLSRSTLIQALGSYVVFRVDEKKFYAGKVEKVVREKPVIVTSDDEIALAINLLGQGTEGVTKKTVDRDEDGVIYSFYFVIEKQKADWRAAQALWEYEIGKATQKQEVSVEAKVSLSDLLS